jgi:Ca2+-binding RTX toxin-like protein
MSSSTEIADFAGNAGSFGYLTVGNPVLSAISGAGGPDGDNDWLQAYLQAGVTYNFFIIPFSLSEPYLELYSGTSNYIKGSSELGDGSNGDVLTYTPSTSGTYWISAEGWSSLDTGSYALMYGQGNFYDDYGASFGFAGNLSASTVVTGSLEFAGDSDGFLVDLVYGVRYYTEFLTTVPDTLFQIQDENYYSLGFGTVGSGDAGTFVASLTGEVLLTLSSSSAVGTGDYYLFLAPTYTASANFIAGGMYNDQLSGTSASDEIQSSWGNDIASGGGGNDFVFGFDGKDKLSGGAGSDFLNGGAGADTLYGGTGVDTLIGGAGADSFRFDQRPSSGGVDVIVDFSHRTDKIAFDNADFTKVGPNGSLNSAAFYSGTKAHDASDRIIYDKASGNLYYDADGTGHTLKVLVAILDGSPDNVSAGDFVVL